MSLHVEEALRAQRDESNGQYVFTNTEGKPLRRDNVRNRVWNPAMKRARLRPRNPYQARHTFASRALGKKESPAWVARMLGHTTTRMLCQRYDKFIRNHMG
jgi:integrase